ncbi:hypothetical protein BASA50_008427 [Batrachochytrium salamandrivorans]|uniref:IMS import disulfide relay-system CHCH-CHCH-like Cx9C domain-containing protein n=1 Tax=Batrachochytrium salamandrivorans TaxID=1357716 RepID=A0ABQ8F5D9_9FUNG|nr:hypothetical protein BASA62_003655 [Batrachochytrium salamandrivorans]KAH6573134.1 hypothetical protein BASA60_006200 [Batrachochytrium salamandrivorans]KAH6578737.1 hypothetical protein BASA61_000442 [Batrachochytrium salamandrivorans]KAH6591913.1 hypothetical protein BASA50_008427 [Batrachochytrium salamandrivorans]KAH9264661.1 hypothetical protein BASA83_011835 [Batrachochytrium salamandrivorans]
MSKVTTAITTTTIATTKGKRGVVRLSSALSACSATAMAYGACINRVFADTMQGSCADEFAAFKACYSKALRA